MNCNILFRSARCRPLNWTSVSLGALSVRRRASSAHVVLGNQSYVHNAGEQPLVYRTVGLELERIVAEYGNTEAIVSCHENRRLTYNGLFDEVNRLAASFACLGLQQGDHLGIWSPNYIHWQVAMLAAARAGLQSVALNPAYQAAEIEYCLKKVNVKAILAPEVYKTQNYYEILLSICPELARSESGQISSSNLPHLKSVILSSDNRFPGAFRYNDVLDMATAEGVAEIAKQQRFMSPDAPLNVQFTSGTTGHPKAAVLSHFNFVNNGIQMGIRNELAGQRICLQVPFFHAFGVVIMMMSGISNGATLVLPAAGFQPEEVLRAIVEEKCTVLGGTPTMYVDLIRKQRELQLPLDTIRVAVTGGAPCSPQLFRDMKSVLHAKAVRSIFGLTETTSAVFQSLPEDSTDQILNTVGHVQNHIEVKVIDTEGHTVPFGEPGELCVRGYLTMMGYHGDEEKTKQTLGNDKWLRTGDQFILQSDGYGRVVGRLKDMIIRGGENVFPKEVEDFCNSHPDIAETHIIGVPDERMGEELAAFVYPRDADSNIDRTLLKGYAKGRLAHFKVPRYVITVNHFPKTTSGKIQKFKLKELFMEMKAKGGREFQD